MLNINALTQSLSDKKIIEMNSQEFQRYSHHFNLKNLKYDYLTKIRDDLIQKILKRDCVIYLLQEGPDLIFLSQRRIKHEYEAINIKAFIS